MIFNKFELLKISGVQRKYVSIILIDDFIIEILHIFQLPDPLSFILFIILNPNYIIKKRIVRLIITLIYLNMWPIEITV